METVKFSKLRPVSNVDGREFDIDDAFIVFDEAKLDELKNVEDFESEEVLDVGQFRIPYTGRKDLRSLQVILLQSMK